MTLLSKFGNPSETFYHLSPSTAPQRVCLSSFALLAKKELQSAGLVARVDDSGTAIGSRRSLSKGEPAQGGYGPNLAWPLRRAQA